MSKNIMPKPATGLYSRSGSTVFQWRIRVPKDLAHIYAGKEWADRRSLNTSVRADATRIAAGLYATWLTKFDQQRKQLNPQPAQSLTPELIKFFADQLKHEMLASDHSERDGYALDWMQAESADENLEECSRLQDAVKTASFEDALPALEWVATQNGVTFNEATPGFKDALRSILHAQLEAASARMARDSGRLVPTPPVPTLKAPEKTHYLRDVFEIWKLADGLKLTPDSIRARERALGKVCTTGAFARVES